VDVERQAAGPEPFAELGSRAARHLLSAISEFTGTRARGTNNALGGCRHPRSVKRPGDAVQLLSS
jgi:hypothetical protein